MNLGDAAEKIRLPHHPQCVKRAPAKRDMRYTCDYLQPLRTCRCYYFIVILNHRDFIARMESSRDIKSFLPSIPQPSTTNRPLKSCRRHIKYTHTS